MQEFQIQDYDRRMQLNFEGAERELSKENMDLIKKHDAEMATRLKKSTRAKHIGVVIDIAVRIGKDWNQVTKSDIDAMIRGIIDEFGDNLGGETETTRDYKKCLKPFFRWSKLGSRDYREIGDPPELNSIHLRMDGTRSLKSDPFLETQLKICLWINQLNSLCLENRQKNQNGAMITIQN